MDRRTKIIKISLWTLVVLSVLLFVVIIIVEHSLSNNAMSMPLACMEWIKYQHFL